jgi:two-component system nitrogen regulation sensor histidine kinase NtrY
VRPRSPRFRTRLLAILLAFALVPAALLTVAWGAALWRTAPLVTGSRAWERIATSGENAIAAARQGRLTAQQRAALEAHEQELRSSLEQARRYRYLAARTAVALAIGAFVALGLLALIASRVAGHLSRQLSRPIDELVGWTDRIAHAEALPETPKRRGAPEFETLRRGMRRMGEELADARRQAVEAERLRAFRESARRVAHELKNPLTPIRLAASRIAASPDPQLREPIDVLNTETERLERMARSFAQFGRMPEGTAADVDIAELTRYAAVSMVPRPIELKVDVEPGLPMVRGHYDSLAGAISNVVLNAAEACGENGQVSVRVSNAIVDGTRAVRVAISDTGRGIAPAKLDEIWEPYITDKPGGTGLGLAIARQAVLAHGGSVGAQSTPGKGTTVELVIPVRLPTAD